MADNAHGQPIEAADLLFGSTDTSSVDFFGSVLASNAPTRSAPAPPIPSTEHVAAGDTPAADSLFDPPASTDSLFDIPAAQEFAAHDSAVGVHHTQHDVATLNYAQSTDYSQQGWYDDDGQWHYYESQEDTSAYYQTDPYSTYDTSQQPSGDTRHQFVSSSHTPSGPDTSKYYAYGQYQTANASVSQYYPSSTYALPAVASASYVSQSDVHANTDSYVPNAVNTQAAYDPYAPTPASQPAPLPYTPPVVAYAPPPVVSTYATPAQLQPSYTLRAALPTESTLSRDETIKPRRDGVSQYRSDSLNAYDPPIPAATRPRIAHSSHAPVSSVYDVYGKPTAPAQQPTPPPRIATVPPPPPLRTGSSMSTPAATSYTLAAAPQINESTFSGTLQPLQPAYSLNSPGLPPAESGALGQVPPLNGVAYSQPSINGYPYRTTSTVQRDNDLDAEGVSDPYVPDHHPSPQSGPHIYNTYAPTRTVSRVASVATPPPRPSSSSTNPVRPPSVVSTRSISHYTEMSPPLRATSVASPPPRMTSVISPPPRAPSVASVISVVSQSGNSHSRYASSSYMAASPQSEKSELHGASYESLTRQRRDTSDYTQGLSSVAQTGDPYRPRADSRTSAVSSSAMSNTVSPPPTSWGSPRTSNTYAPIPDASGHTSTFESYIPPPTRTRRASETPDYGNISTSRFNHPNHGEDSQPIFGDSNTVLHSSTYTAYAPSPSLLGTNDPLGRASAKIPVFSFGFGGKFVTCFHSPADLTDGFDVSFSGRHSTSVSIRRVHEVVPESAWEATSAVYPGPLLSDPGSPTTTLVPPVRSQSSKTKRATVIKYLEDRASEMEQGLAYLSDKTLERHRALAKLVLVRLLRVVVENDGQFSGSDKIEAAVRSALLGIFEDMPVQAETLRPADAFATIYGEGTSLETPLAVYELRPSALDKLRDFLLRGERRKAYHYALDEKMWAHALLLAKDLDKDSWKEAVQEFIRAELTFQPRDTGSASNGQESLRMMYSLISGQGASSVHELLPPKSLGQPRVQDLSTSLAATPMHITPMTANFSRSDIPTNVPGDILGRWQDIAATIISNHVPGDSNGLTALGDTLLSHKWVEAAHACYLLSRSTSSISGCSTTSTARIVLLGSSNPASTHNFSKDPDPFIFSEILEYALSLAPSTSGQDSFSGFPHLQAYRLLRAWQMVEMGHDRLAQRYCDAIASTVRGMNRGSPFFTLTFLEQLKELSDRLTAAPQLDKGGSWLVKKMTKSNIDSLGTWLGVKLTDFIAGEATEAGAPSESGSVQQMKPAVGPFSHFSSISSTTTSASPSPPPTNYPHRAASAVSLRSSTAPSTQIDRAASAIDYLRPTANRSSPIPRIASANAVTSSFSQAAAGNRYGNPPYNTYMNSSNPPEENSSAPPAQDISMPWWGSAYGEDAGATPTATSFATSDEATVTDTSSFISLMETPSSAFSSAPSATLSRNDVYDDVEDLGFGNTKRKSKDGLNYTEQTPDTKPIENPPATSSTTAPTVAEVAKPAGGWLSRLWGSKSEASGPVKANLGEETSFYYDKELKRWVNKKAATTAPPAVPAPPPPRTQSASPNVRPPPISAPPPPSGPPVASPRIPRPASVADVALSSQGPPRPPRIRSNLVPDEPPGSISLPGTPPGSGTATPPMRPKSQASAKRNVRSRYVDVFAQQENNS